MPFVYTGDLDILHNFQNSEMYKNSDPEKREEAEALLREAQHLEIQIKKQMEKVEQVVISPKAHLEQVVTRYLESQSPRGIWKSFA